MQRTESATGAGPSPRAIITPASHARPPLHIGLYGEPHVGKSHFLADVIAALYAASGLASYVAFFDRQGKHLTYEKVWKRRLLGFTIKAGVDKRGTAFRDYLIEGKRFARIAFYAVADVTQTDGASRFQGYFPTLEAEVQAGKWGGFGLDSVSFMTLDARKEDQYVTNPTTSRGSKQHGLQWYGHATDVVEEVLCNQVPNLTCTTVVVMHESKQLVEAEGVAVRSPAIPGKRLAQTNMVAATFPELYRVYVERDETGKKVRRLQTESDEQWQAGSVIGVPDGSPPKYDALWVGWEREK